jgi:hypothetical protein
VCFPSKFQQRNFSEASEDDEREAAGAVLENQDSLFCLCLGLGSRGGAVAGQEGKPLLQN